MAKEKAVYGIIGYPVAHSLSPLMHNTAFKELGVEATYKLFPLKEEELGDFFSKLREKSCNIFGLNVTVPYKEKALRYLDGLSPYAQKAKAVNTIVIYKNRKLQGFNTDGPGFLAHLAELKFDTAGKRVAILGCGGTARAIVTVLSLLPERPTSIKIYHAQVEKAQALIADLKSSVDTSVLTAVSAIDDLELPTADLLINATPLGMKESDPCLVSEELLHGNMLVYDVVYSPAETKLLKLAKKKGAETSNGLKMLFYQGVLAFKHWSDVELDFVTKEKMWEKILEGSRA